MIGQIPQKFRILVADDDSDILDLFQIVFLPEKDKQLDKLGAKKSEGKCFQTGAPSQPPLSFDLVTCCQGNEAVDAVRLSIEEGRLFSVAFIDIRMPPGPDGIWTAEQIRRLDSDIEIVMVTGYTDSNPSDISRRVPPVHKLLYLQKPITIQEIFQFASALSMKWRTELDLLDLHKRLENRIEGRTQQLELVNEKLQIEINEHQKTQNNLIESRAMFESVIESLPFDIFVLDTSNRYILQNSICKKRWGNIIGKCPEDLSLNNEIKFLWRDNNRRALAGETVAGQVEYDRLDEEKTHYYNIIAPIRDQEKILGVVGVLVDISRLKKTEKALHKARYELELRVKKRTRELSVALKNVKQSEKELKKHKLVIEKINMQLFDTNQALSVLARNIDKEKEMLEENINRIISNKIVPIIKELQKDKNCQKRMADLDMLIAHLDGLSPRSGRHHIIDTGLTEQEIRVAVMVKNGLTSQKIADMLCISLHTVKTHRKNIRKKLKIQNFKVNLASYLNSKSEYGG